MNIGHKLTFLVLTDDTKSVISRSRVMLIKTEENNLKLDDDFRKLWNWVCVWSRHDGKEDSIKLPTIDTNFCPYKVEYNSDEDNGQSASAEVPELVLHSHDKDSNKTVSPEQGENQLLSVLAMKGRHILLRKWQMLKGRWTTMMMSSHASYLEAHPGYESGDESKDEGRHH
jgi:hypothetical protein